MGTAWGDPESPAPIEIGARQFVVHEAFEIIWCASELYLSSLTPRQIVISSPLAGALMTPVSRSRVTPVIGAPHPAQRTRSDQRISIRARPTARSWRPPRRVRARSGARRVASFDRGLSGGVHCSGSVAQYSILQHLGNTCAKLGIECEHEPQLPQPRHDCVSHGMWLRASKSSAMGVLTGS